MLRKPLALGVSLALLLSLTACSAPGENEKDDTTAPEQVETLDPDTLFSDRDRETAYESAVTVRLADGASTADAAGVVISGNTVTVTAAGTYVLSGALTDGQLRVQVPEQQKVHLIFRGVTVKCAGGAALYISQADKVVISLTEGTENSLASSGAFTLDQSAGVDAAVYSKADLSFNGTGALAVECESGHGIVSKDDLKFAGGSYTVNAAGQGITGKDCLCIEAGSYTVKSGKDGLHAKNDEDTDRGYVYILGGTFDITAGGDGVDASRDIFIAGGEFTVFTGDGSASVTHSDGQWGGGRPGGWGSSTSTDTEESRKGLKGGAGITITGGSLQIDAEDDAIHSNAGITVSGGTFAVASGDDAFHADAALTIDGGTICITKSYEGLEGNYITVSGGDITLAASDDGMNAAGGNDGSGMAGPWGQGGGFGEATDAYVRISGGSLRINAGGDGIDSNGDLTVTGGSTYVDGPTNSGNGPLDYAGTAKITGGVFIAVGAAGMAMNFGTESAQGAILCSLNGTAPAGTEISVADSDGKVLASHTSQKTFQAILISAPGMVKGETYTVCVGEASGEFTLDSIISGSGSGGPGGGGPGRPR